MRDNEPEIVTDRNELVKRTFAKWRRYEKPRSLAHLHKRLDLYFEACAELQILPSIESLALILGVNRVTVFRWKNGQGCSEEWSAAIQAAYQVILAAVEDAGDSKQIPPLLAIWKGKQLQGAKDTASLEEQALRSALTVSYKPPEQILQKYENLPELPLKADSESIEALEAAESVESASEEEIPADPPEWLYEYARRENA